MTQPTQTRAYLRKDDGTLEITTLAIVDGEVCDKAGYPLLPTAETQTLTGWPDAVVRVYTTGATEYLVPVIRVDPYDAELPYHVAFMLESDGEFEVAEIFTAANDAAANAYAERNYSGREWYVLDADGVNINA